MTKTNPKQNQQPSNEHFKYFKVFYSKDVNKKKRIFSQGILACENKKTRLFNNDGQVILILNQKNNPQIDQQYILNRKFAIVIDSQINKNDFISGKIFIPQVNQKPMNIKNKNQPLHKKLQIQSNQSKSTNLLTGNFKKDITQLEKGLQIENILYTKLREHQIQGVQFMYDCLMGFKSPSICGCILADFMGLGKTLQTITLIYSLLKMKKIQKCIVISPLTLVSVWQKQCKKWLDSKLTPLIGLGDGQQLKNTCVQFATSQYRMLVMSYESFYKYIDILDKKCDLIVFDQGHRLKNKNSKIYQKILKFSCRKRVLLTGTPLQNNLQELYTCISIVNPSLFSSQQLFKNVFQKPILAGMGKKPTVLQRKIAVQRTIQLANKIKQFSLRRKADTLQKYLTIKRQYFVMFRMTPLQRIWYERICKRKQSQSDVLGYLNLLRKLFSHPQILKNDRLQRQDANQFIEDTIQEISYKIEFILDTCKNKTDKGEKVIIVSYFTSTLDFIGKLLEKQKISYVKLDGRSSGKERQHLITSFQMQKSVLLLSGKAGGTGLTLICARTMIMVEPDWNPSNDAQVIGRIWRQGQTQQVSIFRLIMISTFEERIIQRQQLKISLSQRLIDQSKTNKENFDFFNMKKLFIEPSENSILFKPNQNCLSRVLYQQIQNQQHQRQRFKEFGDGINNLKWEGVVFLWVKRSHQDNAKLQNGNNQFDDGSFLVNGLLNKNQEQEEQGNYEQDEQVQEGDGDVPKIIEMKKQKKQINNIIKEKLKNVERQQQNGQKDIIKIRKQRKLQVEQEFHINKQQLQYPLIFAQKMQTHLLNSKLKQKQKKQDIYLIQRPSKIKNKLKKFDIVQRQEYQKYQKFQKQKQIKQNRIQNKSKKQIQYINPVLNKLKNINKIKLKVSQQQSNQQQTLSLVQCDQIQARIQDKGQDCLI